MPSTILVEREDLLASLSFQNLGTVRMKRYLGRASMKHQTTAWSCEPASVLLSMSEIRVVPSACRGCRLLRTHAMSATIKSSRIIGGGMDGQRTRTVPSRTQTFGRNFSPSGL